MNYLVQLHNAFNEVTFRESDHSYHYRTKKAKTSATGFKKTFVPKFRTDYWLKYKTLESLGYTVIADWKSDNLRTCRRANDVLGPKGMSSTKPTMTTNGAARRLMTDSFSSS